MLIRRATANGRQLGYQNMRYRQAKSKETADSTQLMSAVTETAQRLH